MICFVCRITETRIHTHLIFETYYFKIDQFHLICKMIYGNAYRNWETTQCLLRHYIRFSQIICVKVLRKLIFFVPVQDEALYMQTNTHFVVGGDNILSKHCCAAVVRYRRQWCVTQQHTQNPLSCSSCSSGYKNMQQCYVTHNIACLVQIVSENSSRIFFSESDKTIQNQWVGCLVWHVDEYLCEVQQDNIILSCCHCLNAIWNMISVLEFLLLVKIGH